MIRLPKIKTASLSTYGNFAKCHQAHFRVPRVDLGTRLHKSSQSESATAIAKQACQMDLKPVGAVGLVAAAQQLSTVLKHIVRGFRGHETFS